MRKILRPDEVQAMPDIGEIGGKYEQENDLAIADLPVSAISGIPPSGLGGAAPIQRSENEKPEEELQRQSEEEEEEPMQAKLLQRQSDDEEEEEPVQAKRIQRKMADMHRPQPSRFGNIGPEAKAQQAEIHRILRSTDAQAKLTIGQPNDKYEQEADRVADQVMRMSDADVAQRQTEDEEEEETVQAKPLADQITPLVQRQREPTVEGEEQTYQANEMPGQLPDMSNEVECMTNSLRGGGKLLSKSVREYMEPRFGHDFSQVRVHSDSQAIKSAQSINARAFTLGENVVYDSGQYSPTSHEGKRLLAHELTHVIQQGRALSYAKNENNDKFDSTKSFAASPAVRSLPHSPLVQRDTLDLLGFGLRQTLTRAAEFPDPIARIFDGVVASNIAIASEITIPARWQQKLLEYSALNPLDGVVLLRALARFPKFYSGGWIMDLQPAAGAMTLDHSIFVPKGRSLSLSTYIHEMVHVAQYGVLGTTNFLTSYFGLSGATIAIRWARGLPTNPMRSSPHEEQAYNLEARYRRGGRSRP